MNNFKDSKQAMRSKGPTPQKQPLDEEGQELAEREQDQVEFQAKADSLEFLKNSNTGEKDSLMPPPPKKGEIIYCHVCSKAMMREDFSEDPTICMREFKWQTHNACMQKMFNLADIKTPGLLSQRGIVKKKKVIKNRKVSPW